MRFKKIVSVDFTGIEEFVGDKLRDICEELVIYKDFPREEDEIVRRMDSADVMLVSWNTAITKEIISKLPDLKYIGMCCSLYDDASSNVDVISARAQGIVVKGVMNYGDEGVVEYIYSELIRLFKGTGDVQFREEQIELGQVNLGVIGLGTVGTMVADAGNFFGMKVSYHNRKRKEHTEYEYCTLKELLKRSDVISTHLPRNTIILGEKEFEEFGNGKVLINTGLSPSFDRDAFDRWISCQQNFAIFDGVSATEDFRIKYNNHKNVIMTPVVTGFTRNARKRLAHKVMDNLKELLLEN